MMFYYGSGMQGWGIALAIFGNLIFLGILVTAAIAAFRYAKRRDAAAPFHGGTTPQQILAERFARGDIGDDEYMTRLTLLRDSAAASSAAARVPDRDR